MYQIVLNSHYAAGGPRPSFDGLQPSRAISCARRKETIEEIKSQNVPVSCLVKIDVEYICCAYPDGTIYKAEKRILRSAWANHHQAAQSLMTSNDLLHISTPVFTHAHIRFLQHNGCRRTGHQTGHQRYHGDLLLMYVDERKFS